MIIIDYLIFIKIHYYYNCFDHYLIIIFTQNYYITQFIRKNFNSKYCSLYFQPLKTLTKINENCLRRKAEGKEGKEEITRTHACK